LRQIVDDLLWLARADKPEGAVRPSEPADVAALAAELTERFAVVADSRGVALTYEGERDSSLLVWASGAWIERLVGVLVDNACKFAGREAPSRECSAGRQPHPPPGRRHGPASKTTNCPSSSTGSTDRCETGGTGLGWPSPTPSYAHRRDLERGTVHARGCPDAVWWRRAGAAPTGVAVNPDRADVIRCRSSRSAPITPAGSLVPGRAGAHQAPRSPAGRHTVLVGDLARLHRHDVAVDALDEPTPPAGKVEDHLGTFRSRCSRSIR